MRVLFSFILSLCLVSVFSLYSKLVLAEEIVVDFLKQGSQYQQKGFFLDARTEFKKAYQVAIKGGDTHELALTQAALGYSEYLLNHPEKAEPFLKQALDYAKKNQQVGLLAVTYYYLGLVEQSQNHSEPAKVLLQQSLDYANQLSDLLLLSRIHLALANSETKLEQLVQRHKLAVQILSKVPNTYAKSELFLILVEQGLENTLFPKLADNLVQDNLIEKAKSNQHLAYLDQLLQQAKQSLDTTNPRQHAKYYALKARLYQSQQRYTEALQLTQQAIQKLHTEKAQDLLMFYEWQAGQLFNALNKPELAISSYRRAIRYQQAIRQDIPVRYNNGKSSFLELFGPLYREAIGLLLQQAHIKKGESKNTQLSEVQRLLERLKQTELEDFFKDRCLLTEINNSSFKIAKNKLAILYPIVLPDHLELLMIVGDDFYQYKVDVSANEIDGKVRSYASNLRQGREQKTNRQLYNWLFRPMLKQLESQDVETIVYIPDGVLRLLPLSSLHDGKQYLIENYAISTLPSLAILPSNQQTQVSNQTLMVGLSEPNTEIVSKLPNYLIKELLGETFVDSTERSLLSNDTLRSVSNKLRGQKIAEKSRQLQMQQIAEALALPGVKKEIDLLSKMLPGTTILNQDYTLNQFDKLAGQSEYGTIHIASHGFFGGSSDESFIMAYDKLLTIDHLEDLLTARSSKAPIDLLVLSACQTAEGDDRAPLGLSGIALKAKAKTALGSLWPISDEAAVEIMKEFYLGLKQQGLSKAKALQQAQIKLLNTEDLKHPFYWSPFVLVGHWQ